MRYIKLKAHDLLLNQFFVSNIKITSNLESFLKNSSEQFLYSFNV